LVIRRHECKQHFRVQVDLRRIVEITRSKLYLGQRTMAIVICVEELALELGKPLDLHPRDVEIFAGL